MARTAQLPAVRITQTGLDSINELRGAWSISEYVRQAVFTAVKARKQGPKKVAEL